MEEVKYIITIKFDKNKIDKEEIEEMIDEELEFLHRIPPVKSWEIKSLN